MKVSIPAMSFTIPTITMPTFTFPKVSMPKLFKTKATKAQLAEMDAEHERVKQWVHQQYLNRNN
jgi:hypothetical protein